MALQPPVPDDALVHFLRAALAAVLGQPLVEAGRGDAVETAEALWRAAAARGLCAQALARLRLPASVPARVFLERRRLEGERLAGGAGAGKAPAGAGPAAGAPGGRKGGWLSGLLSAAATVGGAGDGASSGGGGGLRRGGPPPDPPASHLLECLEGLHGAASLDAARAMLGSAGVSELPASVGSGGARSRGGRAISTSSSDGAAHHQAAAGQLVSAQGAPSAQQQQQQQQQQQLAAPPSPWLSLSNLDALPTGAAAAASAAAGEAIVAAAAGDVARLRALEARGAAPRPLEGAHDRMLVAAARHGRAAALRHLLPPLLAAADAAQRASRGAMLMGVALRQRRRRALVRLLADFGLAAQAAEGYRLLQARPPARPRRRQAVANEEDGDGDDGDDGTAIEDDEDEDEEDGESDAAVAADAALALELLSAAEAGTREERLLHSWIVAAANDGAARACGRRVAAVLRGVVAAPALPAGARVAAPRALMQRAVIPSADLDVAEAAFAWLERARLVAE